jgi:rhodanese-related sulfurtransferase
MSPTHFRWPEFVSRLEGPEGCDFREENGKFSFKCGGGNDKSKATAILKDMGFDDLSIRQSLAYFEKHGGYCDCEILFNVDKRLKL